MLPKAGHVWPTIAALLAILMLTAANAPTDRELAERKSRIASLDESARQELARKFERFRALTPEEQDRLRVLQAAITADPDSERLMQVLSRYHEWLKTISTAQRAQLAELAPHERVEAIESIRRTQRDAQLLEPLTREDMRAVRRWIDELVQQHRDELEANIPERYRDWYQRQTDPNTKQMALVFRLFGRSRGNQAESDSKVTQEDIDRLTKRLSESAKTELAKDPGLEAQRRAVRAWVFASLRRSSAWQRERRGNALVGEELLRFLQSDVPPAERERLLKLPREEMLQQLRRMYFERGGGPTRGAFDGRPGPPSDFRRRNEKSGRDERADQEAKPAHDPAAKRPPQADSP
jgi:hypothetical protein